MRDIATFICCCHTRLPPRPPPFPYTTLFRSGSAPHGSSCACRARTSSGSWLLWPPRESTHQAPSHSGSREEPSPPGCGPGQSCKDRKSTRLNSSHVAISYAVFCLKKKKHDGE